MQVSGRGSQIPSLSSCPLSWLSSYSASKISFTTQFPAGISLIILNPRFSPGPFLSTCVKNLLSQNSGLLWAHSTSESWKERQELPGPALCFSDKSMQV